VLVEIALLVMGAAIGCRFAGVEPMPLVSFLDALRHARVIVE
jgi:hypothetical protein